MKKYKVENTSISDKEILVALELCSKGDLKKCKKECPLKNVPNCEQWLCIRAAESLRNKNEVIKWLRRALEKI